MAVFTSLDLEEGHLSQSGEMGIESGETASGHISGRQFPWSWVPTPQSQAISKLCLFHKGLRQQSQSANTARSVWNRRQDLNKVSIGRKSLFGHGLWCSYQEEKFAEPITSLSFPQEIPRLQQVNLWLSLSGLSWVNICLARCVYKKRHLWLWLFRGFCRTQSFFLLPPLPCSPPAAARANHRAGV